jgi:hypothetical protein
MLTTSQRAVCTAFLILSAGTAGAATYTVTSAADAGTNTLRWAINQANANAGSDSIVFNIGGGSAQTISLLSALPVITGTVTIDATSQVIELNGASAGAGVSGLTVQSAGSTIRGLVINRFAMHGVLINGGAGGNTVRDCRIGTDATGTAARANGHTGVYVTGVPNNTVGPGNLLSGNGVDGVRIDAAAATGNIVAGNRIGTNAAGTAAIANGFNGVVITAAANNRIGGTTAGELNVISGNAKNGIGIGGGASGNLIERNYIGLAADGAAALGNGEDGVLVIDSPSNKIGGDVAGTFNIISANGWHGIELRGDGADANVVQRNIVGSDLFGTLDRGNGRAGVYQAGGDASGNIIGGGAWGAGGNLISGNAWAGIHIEFATDTVIQGNRIGTDYAGSSALANAGGGIDIVNAFQTAIGNANAGNVISGNGDSGIDIQSENLVSILGNRIGTTADGTAPLANATRGIWIRESWNGAQIGSGNHDPWTCNRDCNLISGNISYGIQLGIADYGSHHVQGNFVGSNLAGTAAVPNGTGILSSHYAQIGGAGSGEGNLVSGNFGHGIAGDGLILNILGNRIGTRANGLAALGNGFDGVRIGQDRVHLELGAAGAGNVIAGNGRDGIQFDEDDPNESANQSVRGNHIGVGADGVTCIGNGRDGIRLNDGSRFIEVGGIAAGEGNRIACNTGNGVTIFGYDSGFGFLTNTFWSNGGLAIDIDNDGVTANDPGDGDVWRENFPVLASAANVASITRISGSLAAAPDSSYRVEFFSNPSCDGSGHGEGHTSIGTTNLTTDGSGNAAFVVDVAALATGRQVTATSTAVSGTAPFFRYSTSEFSACVGVVAPPPAPTAGNNGPICNGQALQLTASAIAGASYAWTGPNGFTSNAQNPSIPNATAAASGSYHVTATVGGVTGPAGTTTATVNTCTISINNPAAVSEGTGSDPTTTFTVSLSHASKLAITLNWTTTNGTATAPADYGAGSGTLTIPANSTSASITRTIVGDSLDEDNETFHIDLSAASAGSLGDARGTVTINDDDAAPTLTADNGGCTVTEGNSGSINCAFVLRLSAVSGKAVNFNTATTGGTASTGTDFTSHAGSARSIAAGQSTLTVNVPVLGDTLDEDDETFTLSVTSVQNATPGSLNATGTITDNDNPPTLSIDGGGCSVIEGDSGTVNCAFVLRLSAASSKTVSFNTATANGTATAGSDYTAHASTARSIAAGQTTLTVNVPVIGDTTEEDDETFTLAVTAVQNAAPSSLSGTGLILSDDLAELIFFDGFE